MINNRKTLHQAEHLNPHVHTQQARPQQSIRGKWNTCSKTCEVYSGVDRSRIPAPENLQEQVRTPAQSKGIKCSIESIN